MTLAVLGARRSMRFVALGAVNTLLTWLLFALLVIWLDHQPALLLSYLVGIVLAWYGNSRLVFRTRPGPLQTAVYPLIYLSTWLVNAGLLEWLIQVMELGPRIGQALALVFIVPLSYLLNATLLAGEQRHRVGLALTLLPVITASTLLLLPTLGGYWLGDDFPNLHRVWQQQQNGELLRATLAFFIAPVDSVGAFYRPLMMSSIATAYLLFGDWYPGWAALSLALHLSNGAMIILVIRRLLAWTPAGEASTTFGPPIALPALVALLFLLNPVLIEAVVWVSARSDPAVTLLTLGALWLWVGQPASDGKHSAWLVPLLMLAALGFKESAVLLPLQIGLLALVWPGGPGRYRLVAVLISALIAGLFMLIRASLFDSAVEVYVGSPSALGGLTSLPAWWQGLFGKLATAALLWLLALACIALAGLCRARGRTLALGLALLAAGAGLALATLINLGGLAASGEGGRLSYGPFAWFAIAAGLSLAQLSRPRIWLPVLLALVAAAALLTQSQLGQFRQLQDGHRQLTAALAALSNQSEEVWIVIVPDRVRFMVALRNAQGGLVMPPVQNAPGLHRVIPGLPGEAALRAEQFQNGLITRLIDSPPDWLDDQQLAKLLEPAAPTWPDRLACWDPDQQQLREMTTPAPESGAWLHGMQAAAADCNLAPAPHANGPLP
jgi:putative flippase GtrA